MEKPKTKEFAEILAGFQKSVKDMGRKNMFLMPKKDDKLFRASRNIPSLTTVLANSLNIVDVLKADSIIVLKDSLPVIEKTYLNKK